MPRRCRPADAFHTQIGRQHAVWPGRSRTVGPHATHDSRRIHRSYRLADHAQTPRALLAPSSGFVRLVHGIATAAHRRWQRAIVDPAISAGPQRALEKRPLSGVVCPSDAAESEQSATR
jgi:hypothetical protein